jgi:hypothetical protein
VGVAVGVGVALGVGSGGATNETASEALLPFSPLSFAVVPGTRPSSKARAVHVVRPSSSGSDSSTFASAKSASSQYARIAAPLASRTKRSAP